MKLVVNGETTLYGIVGNPVHHSFSPEMQTLALQSSGINSVYLPFQITDSDLSAVLKAFEIIGVKGFNVTVPHKENIVAYLSELSAEARFIGAVNTVRKTDSGWKGYCTDGSGFIKSLEASDISVRGKTVLMLGAGGAAKAIAYALAEHKISSLTIQNRSQANALELKKRILKLRNTLQVQVNPERIGSYDILINATSVGMKADRLPISEKQIQSVGLVVDIVYNPPITPLLQSAKSAGIPCLNGTSMLLYQGMEAFEIWTGKQAPQEIMQKSLNNSLAFIQ